jgi:formylglycine-generating enzyme required for sulfatase activity
MALRATLSLWRLCVFILIHNDFVPKHNNTLPIKNNLFFASLRLCVFILMQKIKPEIIQRRIESFQKRFGQPHLYLAYHAAFPLALTSDLLYRLWANFQKDINGELLEIPWIAVADLLLSSLCDEVGHELYEMNMAVRNTLLSQLKDNEKFGQQRLEELSDFLLYYIQQQLNSDDPDIREFAKVQHWTVLAYTQPTQAARELALIFSKLSLDNITEVVRMTSITETFAEPLKDFQPLLTYARGLEKLARGNLEKAKEEFNKIYADNQEITVADINLPIPNQLSSPPDIPPPPPTLSRRKIIQYISWGGVGIGLGTGLATVGANIFSDQETRRTELKSFSFEVITLDNRGNTIDRRQSQARFLEENLGIDVQGNDILLDMVEIPGGTFTMGSPKTEERREDTEGPQHQVTITPFFMGRCEVTQRQYEAIMGNNPSNFKDNGANRPVEQVSWNDAVEFCRRLSQRTGKTYRLPSEAEWEYACRAGTTTPFHFGETITSNLANFNGEISYALAPKGKFRQETTPVGTLVGTFPPNAFGLYDMHGNVWEWCQDDWHDNYQGAPSDGKPWLIPENQNKNTIKLLRGGSWNYYPEFCRCATRFNLNPDFIYYLDFGLRVVLVPA